MMFSLATSSSSRVMGTGSSARPENNDRSISRGFTLLDHIQDGLENFATIPGGKLTTYRFMAEKTADLICKRMGITDPCLTRTEPLPSTPAGMWTGKVGSRGGL